jgi:hypothetical protein
MLQVREVSPDVLRVTNDNGESKCVARVPFSICYLLQHCSNKRDGYAIVQTSHKNDTPPLYFCNFTQTLQDAVGCDDLPEWIPRPKVAQRVPVGVWLALRPDGSIESLPGGLPSQESVEATTAHVQVQAGIQERCDRLQEPESDLEQYTRQRVALAIQALNHWNMVKKLQGGGV